MGKQGRDLLVGAERAQGMEPSPRAWEALSGRLDTWSPRWVAARSLAVARARQGDKEPLRHFIRTALNSDACQAAGLNNDAYWVGATPETYRSDEFMASDLAPWVGVTLLRQFAANLAATEPLADLYVHSTWALLQRRGSVLEVDPSSPPSCWSGPRPWPARATCRRSRAGSLSRFTMASGCSSPAHDRSSGEANAES